MLFKAHPFCYVPSEGRRALSPVPVEHFRTPRTPAGARLGLQEMVQSQLQ